MHKIKLAEALLRRKELQLKVQQVGNFKDAQVYENKVQRISVNDGLDQVTASVSKLTLSQVTAEFDHYARQLRLIDGLIQQCNWTAEIETPHDVLSSYTEATKA